MSTKPATPGPILFCLSSAGLPDSDPAFLSRDEVQAAGLPLTVNGLPTSYTWRRGAQIGEKYHHPSGKYVVNASPAKIKEWEKNFKRMRDDGVTIPLVADHSLKAKDAMGTIVALRRKDGWLEHLLQIIGDDSKNVAAKNETSLGIKPNYMGGNGEEYGEVIEHVASTPIPVVPNLQGLMAASRGEDGHRSVFYLSAASIPPERSDAMKPEHRKMCMAMMSGEDGANDSTDDDTLMSKMLSKHQAMMKDMEDQRHDLALTTPVYKKLQNMSRTSGGDGDPVAVIDELEQKAMMNLSRSSGPTTDPEVLHERQLRVSERFDRLADKGVYTPADVKKLKDVVLGVQGTPNSFTLSRAEGATDCFAAQIADVLGECRPAPGKGEQTGTQVLSRDNPQKGSEENGPRTVKSLWTGKDVTIPAN